MAYPSLTLHLLISAPSDVPSEDLGVVRTTVNGWNVRYGRAFQITVIPVSWTQHAVSEFGDRPQELLNKQIVDSSDLALALFADRLGTPTGTAQSGTAEEIRKMAEAGKHVSILRSVAPRPGAVGLDAAQEKTRLEEYLMDLRSKALVLSYGDRADLSRHVENILSRQATQYREEAAAQRPRDGSSDDDQEDDQSKGVWPRVEVNESAETDSKGRVQTRKHWSLVLENTTGGPVQQVRYELQPEKPEDPPFEIGDRPREPVESMPPGGTTRYPIFVAWQSANQARCVVTWENERGSHTTTATVQTV